MTVILHSPDLAALPREDLLAMQIAGQEARRCMAALAKVGYNLVGEVLKHQGQFVKLTHYPKGDVYDRDSHSQYYYHAHRDGEHGHFHCFLRAAGMPDGAAPVPEAAGRDWPKGDKALAHLVAISMDRFGQPLRLFTTNQWVTGETWYPAHDMLRMIDRFSVDHAFPSWPTNLWLTAMFRLFRPQIVALIEARDTAFAAHAARAQGDPFEDRGFETITECRIDIDAQMRAIAQALG